MVPISELDERSLYEADIAASADEPGDVASDQVSSPTWRYEVWDNLGLDKTISTAAVLGSNVLAFTLAKRDGARMWSDMTATLPDHRGRGLARLVKSATLHAAARNGISIAYTVNDESNAPMLAINTRLGYQPVATQFSCLAIL